MVAQRGVYHYDKPVVVLVNEHTQSAGESVAWTIGKGEKVVLMGQNTSGAFSRVAWLPLPGNLEVQFTAARAELDDGSQLQRVGITPDTLPPECRVCLCASPSPGVCCYHIPHNALPDSAAIPAVRHPGDRRPAAVPEFWTAPGFFR